MPEMDDPRGAERLEERAARLSAGVMRPHSPSARSLSDWRPQALAFENAKEVQMKTIAIMQPYFFPYIGYWQLISAVDDFIILSDVNFIKGGWIHKNRISVDNREQYLIRPVKGASQNKLIDSLAFVNDPAQDSNLLKTLDYAFRDAPCYAQIKPFIRDLLLYPEDNVADYLENQLVEVSRYLGIKTRFHRSAEFRGAIHAPGQRGIIELCKHLGAARYINLPGGRALYDQALFREEGIELLFLEADLDRIKAQFGCEHPDYSILELMARYTPAQIGEMLQCRRLT